MCTNPLLIRNKKFRSISIDVSNSFVKVPCGVCDECLRKRAKDLYVRARFEAEQTFKKGGCGFMCTLTYDDSNVPIFEYEGKKYFVFNKNDVIKFIKRLRMSLDRFWKKHYHISAPDFKYLITSEFGTDPTRSHRPHYHLIILFKCPVSLYSFEFCFKYSLINHKTGKRYFGFIYQCDRLDIKRGGIKYSSKYILKDQTYAGQNDIINKYIKFKTDICDAKFNIIQFPKSEDDFFYNKCVRSSKEYKHFVENNIKPYRHMLQFYMCSNDFGVSSILDVYGENIFSLGVLNIDFFPYSIPKQVVQSVERRQGCERRDLLSKSIFTNAFSQIVKDSIYRGLITESRGALLYKFVEDFLQPRYGSLYFIHPSAIGYAQRLLNFSISVDDSVLEEFKFYHDNNFYELRNEVISLINLSNSTELLEFRAKLARDKTSKERSEYERRKRNKPSNY